jgi:hypothetical protein
MRRRSLYALKDGELAAERGRAVLKLDPPAAPAQRRVATTVIAHNAFDKAASTVPRSAMRSARADARARPARNDLTERLAASVYKQGEQAQRRRRREATPSATSRAWLRGAAIGHARDRAVRRRRRHDRHEGLGRRHAHAGRLPPTLPEASAAWTTWSQARAGVSRAQTLERRLPASSSAWLRRSKDPNSQRGAVAIRRAARARADAKSGSRVTAAKAYERYLKQYPLPLERGRRGTLTASHASPRPTATRSASSVLMRGRSTRATSVAGAAPAPTARATSAPPLR